jgi:hypothetical protein
VLVNNSPYAVGAAIAMDVDGRELFVVAVKAAFTWRPDGSLALLPESPPLAVSDVFGEPPAASGLILANEMSLPKPRVDVIVQGEIVLAGPEERIDCTLEVGGLVSKTLRVFGDRHWRPGAVGALAPSSPKPFVRMPIAWERSFGGTDPDDAAVTDRRNPAGRGVCKVAGRLEGQPAPNFEDPRAPIGDPLKRPEPVGFGAVAPHWQPRSDFAGTYDEAWQRDRYPLLPSDFDARFLNAAPQDQQLDHYQPGAGIRLTNFTPARRDLFALPELALPVAVVEGRTLHQVQTRVDTIVIEPADARLSLVARAVHVPKKVDALVAAFAGPLTAEQRRALREGGSERKSQPRPGG